ncbi:MAG: maleylpyruvate isomerase family mycothiol-dependent enzyme [Nocardioides sp.]
MTTDQQWAFDLLGHANSRLVRTVDGLHGDDWTGPSALPDWSRADVVAHLALNAEALARALHGAVADDDEPRAMYDSDEQRDADIAALADQAHDVIRSRLLAGITLLNDATVALPEAAWAGRIERTPGGRSIATRSIPGMRLREVEIHHVDLDQGYARTDWPLAFAEHLVDAMAKRLRAAAPFEVKPLDSERTWLLGENDAEYPVAVVTGPTADLGWWLTGRPAPQTLSCSQGDLPQIGAW